MSNLPTHHILTSQTYSCAVKRNSTVMVMITFETTLNEEIGYHFCQVILLFWLRQKAKIIWSPGRASDKNSNYECFYQMLSRPSEKQQTTPSLKTIALQQRGSTLFMRPCMDKQLKWILPRFNKVLVHPNAPPPFKVKRLRKDNSRPSCYSNLTSNSHLTGCHQNMRPHLREFQYKWNNPPTIRRITESMPEQGSRIVV